MKISKLAATAALSLAFAGTVSADPATVDGVFDSTRNMFQTLLDYTQLQRFSGASNPQDMLFQVYGAYAYQKSSNAESGIHSWELAANAMYMQKLDDKTNFGIGLNMSYSRGDLNDAHGELYAVRPVGYFGTTIDDKIDIDAAVEIGYNFVENSGGGVNASRNVGEISASGKAGYRFDVAENLVVEPVGGLTAGVVRSASQYLSGADSKYEGKYYYTFESIIGVKAFYTIKTASCTIVPQVYANWRHQFADREYKSYLVDLNGLGFSGWDYGHHYSRDYFDVGAAAIMPLNEQMKLAANYNVTFANNYLSNMLSASFEMTF